MVSCKQCQTPNSLDSTFCKRCGTAISDIELQEAQAKLEKLVEEGNTLFNQGRIDEALAVAEAANISNPSSISALSLKTLCHERRGEIAEALECADRLVELNPGSDFDRIRRASLRQKLQTDLYVPAAPDRRLAAIGGAAAVVLMLCIGAFVAKVGANSPPRTAMNSTASPQGVQEPNQLTGTGVQNPSNNPVVGTTGGTGETNSGTSTVTPGSVGPLKNGREQQTEATPPTISTENLGLPHSSGPTLPAVGSEESSVKPVDPKDLRVETSGPAVPTPTSNNVKTDQNDPPVDKHIGEEPPKAKALEDQGVYQINVRPGTSRPPNRTNAGAEPVGVTGLEALVRVGSQQFQLGNYAGAAKSYEQAVRGGGDGVILNRRLAQAYERLGRTSDASDAYRRCISAIDSALASGRGNRDNLSNTRSLCEQALKVLQGG
ncbi:tetratricopeptide repeat protein [Fimbriimonas ginsengisoli]|uniref:Tetratricopeptide repeat protein n=1 Tax=Fimbriimonas ginsengisoli Gsoil 348 TaxID=661478 RepID=A0A068NJF3_FIMGI|nr:tetratricopeptide repeat protein [Fimbriimonas ginsengisoli]AIE83621.1 hypothetical protein OP10G_0253 [Fimbriimonas ginsengisoli Gsoil 348]